MSGQPEPLVVVKPSLVEPSVSVLALNPWVCGMTLALLVVGQVYS